MEYRARPSATHLIACRKHAPDHRFPVLAIARPGSWSKYQVGDLAQAGAIVASIGGVQRVDPASELQMSATGRYRRCEGTDRGKPRLQITVV